MNQKPKNKRTAVRQFAGAAADQWMRDVLLAAAEQAAKDQHCHSLADRVSFMIGWIGGSCAMSPEESRRLCALLLKEDDREAEESSR